MKVPSWAFGLGMPVVSAPSKTNEEEGTDCLGQLTAQPCRKMARRRTSKWPSAPSVQAFAYSQHGISWSIQEQAGMVKLVLGELFCLLHVASGRIEIIRPGPRTG